MIRDIPKSALILGIAGLLPFMFGAVIQMGWLHADMGDPNAGGYPLIVPADGRILMIRYGTVILSFMSGVLWGFATKAEGSQAATGYLLSVLPALWAFFMVGGGPVSAGMNLIAGFVALLVLDFAFWTWGLAPRWWMALRVMLTAIVILCLIPVIL